MWRIDFAYYVMTMPWKLKKYVILKCRAYNDIRTDLFTYARSIHPNSDNFTDDDKLALILTNTAMVSNTDKACHQILSNRIPLMYR